MQDQAKNKGPFIDRTTKMRQGTSDLANQVSKTAQDREEKLKAVAFGSPIPQFVIDSDHRIILWNKSLEQMSGLKAEEMLGTNQHWRAFYKEPRSCLADFLVDGDVETIQDWYGPTCSKSKLVSGAYEATEFFPSLGNQGKWLHFTAAAVTDADENIIGAVETLEDITELKTATEALRKSEQSYRTFFEDSKDGMYSVLKNGEIKDANPAFCEFFGYPQEELIGKNVRDLYFDPDDRSEFQQLIGKQGFVQDYAVKYRKRDGNQIDGLLTSSVYFGEDGSIAGYRGIVRDVTHQKRAAEALRESEERFRRIFEQGPLGLAIANLNYRWILANAKLCEMTGYSEDELLNLTFLDITHPEDLPATLELAEKLGRGEIPFYTLEKRYMKKSGEILWAQVTGSIVRDAEGKPLYFLCMTEDISHRKSAEEALRKAKDQLEIQVQERTRELKAINEELLHEIAERVKSEEALRQSEVKFKAIFNESSEGILVSDPASTAFKYANPTICNMLGYTQDELMNLCVREIHPEDKYDLVLADFQAIARGEKIKSEDVPCLKKDGTIFFADISGGAITLDGIPSNVGFFSDITERKIVEEALRESEKRFRAYFDLPLIGIAVTSVDKTWIEVNDKLCGILGYSRDELTRMTWMALTHPDDLEADIANFQKVIRGEIEGYSMQKRFFTKEGQDKGEVVWTDLSVRCLRKPDGTVDYFVALVQDITERRKAEEEISTSLKEKEVLLREIHHRVRNNLAVVSSLLRLQSRYAKDEYHVQMFKESQDRIMAMVLAHEKLYRTDNLAAINIKTYLESLVSQLMIALGRERARDRLQLEAPDLFFDLETCVTLGFIVTELVSNCLKHAFRRRRIGKIMLSLKEIEDSTFELSVADDGVGLPEDFQFNRPDTMGLNLIRIFAGQLHGQLEIRRDHGTEVTLRFDISP